MARNPRGKCDFAKDARDRLVKTYSPGFTTEKTDLFCKLCRQIASRSDEWMIVINPISALESNSS